MEVEACEPANEKMKEVLDSMSQYGVKYLYGRWLVEGSPYVLLFDTGSVANKLDEWKGDLWRSAGIPSPPADTETNDAILFGYLVTWFMGEFTPKVRVLEGKKKLGFKKLRHYFFFGLCMCSTTKMETLLLSVISMNG